jgi:hypothetical protein
VREGDDLTTFKCQMSIKSGSLNLLEPSGPHRAYNGTPLPLTSVVGESLSQVNCLEKNVGSKTYCHRVPRPKNSPWRNHLPGISLKWLRSYVIAGLLEGSQYPETGSSLALNFREILKSANWWNIHSMQLAVRKGVGVLLWCVYLLFCRFLESWETMTLGCLFQN